MLVIRFLRVGKKNQPSFKIVVVDKRKSSKSGRFIEEVGFYNPLTKEKVLKGDRIKYWISVGVQPSPTVHNLLIKEKILEGKKIPVHKKSKKKEEKPSTVPASAGSVSVAKAVSAKEAAPADKKATEGKEKKPEEVKPVPETKPEAKTEEKPAEKTEIPKEAKVPKEGKPETK
jgi:small subunit ribosomal protein S16